MRRLVPLLSAALVSVAAACSGSGNGDVVTDGQCLEFAVIAPPAANTVTASLGAGSTCGSAGIDLSITDVADVFALSFTFRYDPAVVSYESLSTVGSLLSSDGTSVEVLEDPQPGRVTVGLTRLGSTGIDAVGTRHLITLRFSKATEGVTDSGASFSNTEVLGSEAPPQPKAGIAWLAGTFLVK